MEENLPLVRHVVGRLLRRLPTRYEADELVQWGVCGLLHAARAFDESHGVTFATFAYRRIQGAILDELRKLDTRTRTERDHIKRILRATEKIEGEHLRPARPEEIAAATGLRQAQVTRILRQRTGGTVSLDDIDDDGDEPTAALEALASGLRSAAGDGPEAQAMLRERKELLAEALRRLSERERQIIVLYYYKNLRVKEIAAAYGVTEGRISQLHTRALRRLGTAISAREGGR